MKKYLRLVCSVCKRSIDKLVDDTHFSPDKCTITFKCNGTLTPFQYISNGSVISTPVSGVEDWRPRGITVGNVEISQSVLVDTSCGDTSQIVLAVESATPIASGSTLTVTFDEQSNTPKNFRQYVYRIEGSFISISGVESGLERKTLRYTSTDSVEVFLNGVKIEQGSNPEDYIINDGTPSSGSPPNVITFNQSVALPGVTQVDVIVSPLVISTQKELTFVRNEDDESRINTGAWENVDYVSKFKDTGFVKLYLFVADLSANTTALDLNSILIVNSSIDPKNIKLNGSLIPTSRVSMLLSRKPYSTLDRYTTVIIPLSNMDFSSRYLKYTIVSNKATLQITSSSIDHCYPPLAPSKFNIEKTIKINLGGVVDQITIDGNVIVGPDA